MSRMTKGAPWTEEEIERLIRTIEQRRPIEELSRQLGRTREEIEIEAFHLAISLALDVHPSPAT